LQRVADNTERLGLTSTIMTHVHFLRRCYHRGSMRFWQMCLARLQG
jgi:hypothetical protein